METEPHTTSLHAHRSKLLARDETSDATRRVTSDEQRLQRTIDQPAAAAAIHPLTDPPPVAVHTRNNASSGTSSSSSGSGSVCSGVASSVAMVQEAGLASPGSAISAGGECSSSASSSPPTAAAVPAPRTALERMQARLQAAKAGTFAISRTAYDRAIASGLTPAEAQQAADEAVAAATGKPVPVRATSEQDPLPPTRTPSLRNAVSEGDLEDLDDSRHHSIPQLPNAVQAALLVPPIQRQASAHSNLPSRSATEWAERDREFMEAMCFGVASAQGDRAHMEDEHRIVPHFDQLVRLVHTMPPPTPPPAQPHAHSAQLPPPHPAPHSTARPASLASSAVSSASSSASTAAVSSAASPVSAAPSTSQLNRGLQSFFGVYDGHGGREAAEFVRDHLHINVAKRISAQPNVIGASGDEEAPDFSEALKQGAADTESALLAHSLSHGSTAGAVVAFTLFCGMQLYVCHAGDTRAVLCREGVALDLTQDHKPGLESEQSRVAALGGFIADGRVNGEIAVSRAMGDANMETGHKMLGLSGDVTLSKFYLSDEDEFVILACDGLWDVMSSAAAVSYARRQLTQHNDIQRCADELVAQALRQQTTDNVSVLVIGFTRPQADGEPIIVPKDKSRLGHASRASRIPAPPRPKRLQLNSGGLSKLMAALDIQPPTQEEATETEADEDDR